jgi:tetratricopeptide (TPR) repeat protein
MLELVSPADPPAHPVPQAPKYWAFLSYSHHDKAVAKRLQRQLETYRLPRRLIGRETSEGPVPARVLPVFRDRDELHAGADLKSSVQDALSRSRWLIVVCTPDAARSPWVNREIIEFKRLRGERHVLALIVRGEPFASDLPGREAEECFPPALRRALTPEGVAEGEPLEPIAADMRKHGDGPQRAMLKLLAGMVGVSFDDLVRRDLQRRLRWMSALVGASVLGVMVFALMAVMAVRARNEAQLQRVQAEGLIEFMLGDLRKKLEPVGRLEVLDSVGEKALAYYGAQDADRLDATALGHRSRAMHLIGEIRDLRGNPAEAQAAFEQAASTTAQLLAKSPSDGQRIFDHAQSVYWVGYAAWKRADGKTAEAKFQEYLDLAQRLVKIDPTNLDWLTEMAYAHGNLGAVQLGTGRPSEALSSFQAGGALLEQLASKRPELIFDVAHNLGWRANAYEMLGDYVQSLAQQQRKLKSFLAMPDADKNRAVQRGILISWHSISVAELALGHMDNAEADAKAAMQLAETLISVDPKNLRWRGDECLIRLRLVEISMAQGRTPLAREQLQRATACVAAYNASGTTGFRDSILVNARALYLSARLVDGSKQAALAAEMERFLSEATSKLAADTSDRASVAAELANVAIAIGELQVDNQVLARLAWSRVPDLLGGVSKLQDGAVLTPLARAHLYLGNVTAAEELVARIERTSYRHPAYATLVKQLQAARGGGTTTTNRRTS